MEHPAAQQAKRCFADRSTLCCRRPDRTFAQYRVFLIHAALAGQPQDRQDTNFAPEGCFYREVNNILAEDTGLGIYDPDRSDETTACYNAGSTEDNYGRITILLRDVTDVQDPITGDTFAYDDRDECT